MRRSSLGKKFCIRSSRLWKEQCVIDPSRRLIGIKVGRFDVVVSSQDERRPTCKQALRVFGQSLTLLVPLEYLATSWHTTKYRAAMRDAVTVNSMKLGLWSPPVCAALDKGRFAFIRNSNLRIPDNRRRFGPVGMIFRICDLESAKLLNGCRSQAARSSLMWGLTALITYRIMSCGGRLGTPTLQW